MNRSAQDYVDDIRNEIRNIGKFTANMDFEAVPTRIRCNWFRPKQSPGIRLP